MSRIRLIIAITILTVFIPFSSLTPQKLIESVAAIVGNEVIYLSEIEEQVAFARLYNPRLTVDQARCAMLDTIIEQNLYLDQARIDSIVVTPSMVESNINMRLNMAIVQAGSEERLEEHYNKSIFDIRADLRDMFVDQQIISIVQDGIASGITVTPSEVRRYYNSIHPDSIPLVPAKVEVSIIEAYPPQNEENRLLARGRLLDIRSDILSGDRSFEMSARLYSEDPGSAVRGGELGLISRAELAKEYADMAFSLNPNTVSRVVETEFGFHIIQLIERRGDLVNTRHILIKPRLTPEDEAVAKNTLDSIADLVRKDTLSFGDAARRFSTHSDSRLNGGKLVKGEYSNRFKLFALEELDPEMYQVVRNMNVGEISRAYKTTNESQKTVFRIVRLDSEIPAHRANLNDDFEMLRNMALREKYNRLLDEWLDRKFGVTYIRISDEFNHCELRFNK
jgi:peptidyl-prolyl cis-trans isomerase SurA